VNPRASAAVADVAVAGVALLIVAAVLELWVGAVRVPGYLLPAPSAVGARLVKDAGMFASEAGITLAEAAAGFALGTGSAFAAASVMTFSRALERTIFPVAILVKLTPVVAVAPLFTLWFGFGAAPKIAIVTLLTFFPMLVNAFVGLRSVDPQELAFLQSLGASRLEVFWRLRAPTAMPYVFSAARVSTNLALIGAVVAEWTGAEQGLGRVIFVANANLDLTALFGAVLVLAVAGIGVNALVSVMERRILHWHPITLTA
jgi:ABC-type nitrate/sulfonate/bicarbonate transport system permease component